MNASSVDPLTLDDIRALGLRLSTLDKVRLVERLTAGLEQGLSETVLTPLRSLLGMLDDLSPAPSEADIDEVRRQRWERIDEGDDN
jgi:hypothetical protein